MGVIVILASYEHYFIRVHKNLVQHPSNIISIVITVYIYNKEPATTRIY